MKLEMTGQRAIIRAMQNLEKNAAKKIARKMVTAGNKVILRGAKRRVAVDTRTLKKSLGQRVKVYRNSGTVVGIVGPRIGKAVEGKEPTKYAHFAERKQSFLQATLDEDVDQIRGDMANAGKAALEFAARG